MSLATTILSAVVNVLFFYYLTGYPSKIQLIVFLLILSIFADINVWGSILANIAEVSLFLVAYRKKNWATVFSTAIICLFCDLLSDTILNLFPKNIIAMFPYMDLVISVAIYLMAFALFKSNVQKIRSYLQKLSWQEPFMITLIYEYISLVTLNTVVIEHKWFYSPAITLGLVIILQALFAIVMFHSNQKIQESLLNKQKQKELEEYANYLEQSEDNLRAFRHDYRNLLNSMKVSAAEGNVQELLDKLERYSAENLDSQALLKYKDTNHIQIKTLKSLIITKLNAIYQAGIPYDFECRQTIASIPGNVDELDLVRVIGIAFDNALEESQSLSERNGHPEIQAMLYQETTDSLEFEIQNKIVPGKRQHTNLATKGFTTKTGHQGLGLANLQDIEQKYSELDISYNVSDGWFDLYLTIDQEEDE
ncbi:GHKL domain-containing protein [Lactobacillus delbrueckii subsp. indicus]|uniref:GHKL domain-containing protein n=1 Tax=Lactobacillus delbrueckii TaxID=1584 RepID=UPI002225ECE9|nr:GHKL domain-containing protein [Lactobacillus delbrueckii]UYY84871.1 GHKL domain-containing protein [Lactobacillus delbrueckii subsp. indicus]